LIELLIVIVVIAILSGISMLAFGTSKAQQLNVGGNAVVELINQARQNAMTTRNLTALFLLTSTGQPSIDGRAFVIEQYDAVVSQWQQISKWDILPTNVVVDSSDSATPATNTFISSVPALNIPAATLSYLGQSIPSGRYAFQAFLFGGQLVSNGTSLPPVLKLVLGTDSNGTVVYSSQTTGGASSNYYQVTINPYTGIPTVTRP